MLRNAAFSINVLSFREAVPKHRNTEYEGIGSDLITMEFKCSSKFDNAHRTMDHIENTSEGTIVTSDHRSFDAHHLDSLGDMEDDVFSPGDDPSAPIPIIGNNISSITRDSSASLSSAQVFDRPNSAKNYKTAETLYHALEVSSNHNYTNQHFIMDMTSGLDDGANDIDDDLSAAEFHPEPMSTPMFDANKNVEFDDDLSLEEFQPLNAVNSPSPLKMTYGNHSLNNLSSIINNNNDNNNNNNNSSSNNNKKNNAMIGMNHWASTSTIINNF